jgi:phosphatidylserine/phosphatidylglycerophosphate/cardiolipin synthase-like enzyme
MDTLAQIATNATVRLVVDSVAVSGRGLGDMQTLWDAGVQVASFHKDRASMHLKAAVIDERHVWTGSLNWTPTALDGNYEDVLWTDPNRPPVHLHRHVCVLRAEKRRPLH